MPDDFTHAHAWPGFVVQRRGRRRAGAAILHDAAAATTSAAAACWAASVRLRLLYGPGKPI
jgi:hypothetical protein